MFRFTIRDVLWLMVVVAVVCYAYRDRRAVEARMDDQLDKVVAEFASKQEKLEIERLRWENMINYYREREAIKERERAQPMPRKRKAPTRETTEPSDSNSQTRPAVTNENRASLPH